MEKLKKIITKKLISGFSVTILISFFSVFLGVVFMSASKQKVSSIFIELKPEPVVNSDYPVYRVQKIQYLSSQITAVLKLESEGSSKYGPNIDFLSFQAVFVDKNVIRFQITDKPRKLWQLDEFNFTSLYSNNNYELFINNYPFGVEIKDKKDGSSVFNSIGLNFYFSQRYLEIGTFLREGSFKFGVGERKGNLMLPIGNHSIWTNSENSGHHPLYLEVLNKSSSGIFFHNFNAMQIEVGKSQLKFRTTGGVIDFFIFLGKTGEDIIRNFHTILGPPDLPLFSDLGYHYGERLTSSESLLNSLTYLEKQQIPVDRLWLRNFLSPTKSFEISEDFSGLTSKLSEFNTELLLEVSSEISENSEFFELSKKSLLPFKANGAKGPSYYLDWFHQDSSKVWHEVLEDLITKTNATGLSLTENEVSTGESSSRSSFNLPFEPMNCLEYGTIPLDTSHANSFKEIDLHSLWGDMQVKASRSFYLKKNQRPCIFSSSSRSGTPSFRTFSINRANWDLFRESINSVLSFEMFGIRAGSNICGLKTLGRLEMCLRWHQISSMLPMMINLKDDKASESQVFDKTILPGIQEAIMKRYSLSLFFYSLFFESSLHGGSIVKPVLFEFLEDQSVLFPHQFLIGSCLLGVFSLFEKSDEVLAYFPRSRWFGLWDGKEIIGKGNSFDVDVREGFELFLRGGFVVPLVDSQGVRRILDVRKKGLTLVVALDDNYKARGVFYVDDGISPDTLKSKKFTKVTVEARKEEYLIIKVTSVIRGYLQDFNSLVKVKVFGYQTVRQVLLNNQYLNFTFQKETLEILLSVNSFENHEILVF